MLPILAIVCLFVSALASTGTEEVKDRTPVSYVDIKDRIEQEGYYSESHHVTTSDGYILEVNRIPFGRFQNGSSVTKPVVFLLHGLQSSAVSYLVLGHEFSLGYLLADAGFDVWMGNVRGAHNSRNHVTLDPDRDELEFFDYSFEDIATKDLPSMIDYILELTGQEKLHYIGHSQGGTAFLVLNSLKPEYNDKISAADLLAGVGYMQYFPNIIFKAFALSTNTIFAFALRIGTIEVFGPTSTKKEDCSNSNASNLKCVIQSITDYMKNLIGSSELLAGASLKQYAHYGQNIKAKTFKRWDYGLIGNMGVYGKPQPPKFDISKITINTLMHYTVGDDLLDERDVLNMAKDMPNTEVRRVAKDSFSHTDFVGAEDSKELVTGFIVEKLKKLYL